MPGTDPRGTPLPPTPSPSTPSPHAVRGRGRHARTVARIVLALAAVALLARVVVTGWADIVTAATVLWQQRPGTLVVMSLLVTAWIVALAEVQRASARALGARVSRRDALRISRGAFTLSRVVPGGGAAGGVFAIRELARLGHGSGVAAGTAVVSWSVSTATFAAVVLLPAVLVAREVPGAALGPAAAALLTVAAVAAVVLRAVHAPAVRDRLRAMVAPSEDRTGRVARVRRLGASVVGEVPVVDDRVGRRAVAAAAGWAAFAWMLDLALLATVFAAVGAPLPIGVLLAGAVSATLLNSAPELTPGWIGVYEVAVAALYVALGVPADVAVVAVLLHRLVAFWVPVGVGVVPAVRSLATGRRVGAGTEQTPSDGVAPPDDATPPGQETRHLAVAA